MEEVDVQTRWSEPEEFSMLDDGMNLTVPAHREAAMALYAQSMGVFVDRLGAMSVSAGDWRTGDSLEEQCDGNFAEPEAQLGVMLAGVEVDTLHDITTSNVRRLLSWIDAREYAVTNWLVMPAMADEYLDHMLVEVQAFLVEHAAAIRFLAEKLDEHERDPFDRTVTRQLLLRAKIQRHPPFTGT